MRRNRDQLAAITFLLVIATLMYLLFQMARWYYSPPDQPKRDPVSTFERSADIVILHPTTTTSSALHTQAVCANRGTRRTSVIREVTDGFWERLARCESGMGRTSRNIFQFSPDTAGKVGIDGSEPYDVQKMAAVAWAARIHPREGTSAGWPNCWWVALRN